jgi:hypothetical protein
LRSADFQSQMHTRNTWATLPHKYSFPGPTLIQVNPNLC